MHFVNEKICILIEISLKFVPRGPIENNPALVQIMAWYQAIQQAIILINADLIHWCIYAAALAGRWHYNDVITDSMASQIISLTIVYSALYSGADHRKHQSSTSLAFVWGIHPSCGKCFHLMMSRLAWCHNCLNEFWCILAEKVYC